MQKRKIDKLSQLGGSITFGNVTGIRIVLSPRSDMLSVLEGFAGQLFSEKKPVDAALKEWFDEKGNQIPKNEYPVTIALRGTITTTTTTGPSYFYARRDGTKFPVSINVTPVIVDNKIIGAIDVFRDITKEKDIDKAKNEFVSLASHQLKTPPTAIKMLTERLLGDKMGKLEKNQKEYLTDIRYSNQRMIDLVNALLNVSRIELGAFIIQVNEKDACAIMQSILDELKSVIDKQQLKVKTIAPKNNILLMLDEPLFRTIINNVIIARHR